MWDLEDVKLCKNIDKQENIIRLKQKHGDIIEEVINCYSYDNINLEYNKYPTLEILTWDINESHKKIIIEKSKDNEMGFSLEGRFLGNWDNTISKELLDSFEFQNDDNVLDIFNYIFGDYGEYGIEDSKYPIKNVFIEQIKETCKAENSRSIDNFNEPMIIMAFLPQNNIYEISLCTKQLLEKRHKLFHPKTGEYIIVNINSKEDSKSKDRIEKARNTAKILGMKGVLVLSGRQCHLGVSIKHCDIVLLLNNNLAFDMIYQMMFRCMTEEDGKKLGFVVDLNIHRTVKILMDYINTIRPNEKPKESIKKLLHSRQLRLNSNHWNFKSGNNESRNLNNISDKLYSYFFSFDIFKINSFLVLSLSILTELLYFIYINSFHNPSYFTLLSKSSNLILFLANNLLNCSSS